VSIQNRADIAVPTVRVWPDIVPMVSGKSANTILAAIEAGTKAAYDTNNLPYLEVKLDTLSPESVADFMQFKMCEMMMLGHLLKVDPFDQPQVEQYKTVTKQILGG
jgi:glucose-6-phosphate isomerase